MFGCKTFRSSGIKCLFLRKIDNNVKINVFLRSIFV